jgi:hypothetical protein
LPREHAPESGSREGGRENTVDVEQIMRDIRARIAQRHGIELSNQQIQELAARRLDAILEPRNVKPQLLEQLRRSAGAAPELPESAPVETYQFEDTTLYETHRGILRFFRKLLNPILKLFFNPTPLIQALHTQARINTELAARELERERRQSEWNALQFELVQRVVLETSRISIEMQALSSRIESLSAKVDFNERRVRGLETAPSQPASRPQQRQQEPVAPPSAPSEAATSESVQAGEGAGDGSRKRRRRRRGRRGGAGTSEPAGAAGAAGLGDDDLEAAEGMEAEDEAPAATPAESAEAPVTTTALVAPIEPVESVAPEAPPVAVAPVEPVDSFAAAPTTTPPQEPAAETRAPIQEPIAPPAPVSVPTPPRDEPTPDNPVDHADPGPEDR